MKTSNTHLFPSLFMASAKVFADRPFIYERHEKMFVSKVTREVATEVNSMARMLNHLGITLDTRVAFCGLAPSKAYWVTQWATLCLRATSVIIPAKFSEAERTNVLAESRSTIAVVSNVNEATLLVEQSAKLPDLKHVLCVVGKSPPVPQASVVRYEDYKKPALPVHYYAECIDRGNRYPDRTAASLAALLPSDRAVLYFFHDAENKGRGHKVIRYTHAQLYEHARVIERLLGDAHAFKNTDIVLTALSWNQMVANISSCFLPMLRDAAIQINFDKSDFSCFENHPNVLIADADYILRLKQHIEDHMKRAGKLDWRLFKKALAYGKRKYEKENAIGFFRKISDRMLDAMVVRKVVKMLGGRLRLIIGVDDAASYEVHTFFHTFGVDLVEMPAEAFIHIADSH